MKKNELPKEVNDYMDEYIKTHTIKNMDDMQEMMRNLFGPALQKMLDAEMETNTLFLPPCTAATETMACENGCRSKMQ